ncbi:MAG: type II toxin-antitoxin system PemK/MazF family toxin [Rothia sp. (in: high G+C Gram-positive bacteria)]|nr:type II toxin-antitoxin system PemK/MazF family toxin [Rothia sp. (in: high G+C Gram-positive bacteria)]
MKITMRTIQQALNIGQRIYREWNKYQNQKNQGQVSASSRHPESRSQGHPRRQQRPDAGSGSWEKGGYPGDYTGQVAFDYSPALDGDADPGEVVWAWVPFEEDYSQGKDRPVLVVGRSGAYLLGLMLTTKDHTNARTTDPNYLDIGAGAWDKEGRASEVKLNRVVQLKPSGIRREGAIMDRETFDFIAAAYRQP